MDSAATLLGAYTGDPVESAYDQLLDDLPGPRWPGVERTPQRAAAAWRELTRGYQQDPRQLLTLFDAEGYDEMILVRDIPFYSLCEHHLLPFHGLAQVGYIPSTSIVGLSKIARVVDAYARRLQVQERLTDQIADLLWEGLAARGVIVILSAEHLCMTMRGVMKPGALTTTSVVRGILKDDPRARHEALALLGRP